MTSLEKLVEFLRIPSVSSDPTHAPDVRRAAEWVRTNTPAGSRLYIWGFEPVVYDLAAREPATLTLLAEVDRDHAVRRGETVGVTIAGVQSTTSTVSAASTATRPGGP